MTTRDLFSRLANPHRLYRDTERGKLAGVCAGVADYFGIDPLFVRLAAVLGLIFFFVPTVVTYVVLALLLKRKPPALYQTPEEEEFWRGVATAPNQTFHDLRRKFRDLEQRLAQLEGQVTSEEFELRRNFRDLGA